MEIEEKRLEAEKAKALKVKVSLILLGIGIALMLFGTIYIKGVSMYYNSNAFVIFGFILTVVGAIGLFKQR